jgi:beta-lactamase regulating signal transducer with metallopeptidase domain/biopolymer transport protein ExbD
MVVSAIIPFLNVQLFYKEIEIASTNIVREIVSTPTVAQQMDHPLIIHTPEAENIESINYWSIIYIAIISLLLFRFISGIYRVAGLIKNAEKHRFRKIILAVVKDVVQPFTFLNKVVLSEKDFLENKAIVVAHEYAHIRHKHAVDLLFCELFTTVHFFNPFMWLLRRDLKLVHEYQADKAVLDTGIDAQKYQLLVLEKAVGERRFAMAHHFSQKPIVKRLKMMTKTKRRKWGMVKMILFVPLIIVLLQAFARPDLITKSADFIPIRYTENKAEQWLTKWNIDNIGDGVFDPAVDRNQLSEKENNVLVILMNIKDEYLVEGEQASKESIKTIASGFIQGVNPGGSDAPDFIEKEIPGIGKVKVFEGLISYRNDIESSSEAINFTLRKIGETYLEAREAKAFILFGKNYFDLDEEKQKTINEIIPIRFSYETPKNPRTSTWLPFQDKPSPEPKPMEMLVRYDGSIVFGNKNYENLDEFEYDLKVWKKELDAISKEEKKDHYYRVNATFEHGSETQQICSKEISKINYMLWKQSMHVEQIHHVFPEEIPRRSLEMDKLKTRMKQVNEDAQNFDVKIHPNKIEVSNKICALGEVRQAVVNTLKLDENKKSINVLSFSDVSGERLNAVLNELNQIPLIKISTTVLKLEQKPVTKAQHKILLKANGRIYMDEKECDLKEFVARIDKIKNQSEETTVTLNLEPGVTYLQSETVLSVLRKADIDQVGYSIQRHSVRESEPGTKIGEPSYTFGYTWTGIDPVNLNKLKREAASFLSGKGNRSLYTSISPDKNATQKDIETVTQVLLDAGFLKVDISNSRH